MILISIQHPGGYLNSTGVTIKCGKPYVYAADIQPVIVPIACGNYEDRVKALRIGTVYRVPSVLSVALTRSRSVLVGINYTRLSTCG
jgi:hypothetical protein